jgi:hypothetical protein
MISFSVCVIKDEENVFLLRPNALEYFADPFIFSVSNDSVYVLVEFYRRFRRKGEICLLTINFQRKSYSVDPLISENYHLSYPCVIRKDSNCYVFPESEAASAQYLYLLEWEGRFLKARKTVALSGRYVDLTVRAESDGRYNAQFYNGTSNSNGYLLEAEIMLNGAKEITLGREIRVKGRRRPGGLVEGMVQPFQRPNVEYGSGLDLVDASGELVSPKNLGYPSLVCTLQDRMHHLSQAEGIMAFDVKEGGARIRRKGNFSSASQILECFGIDPKDQH